ncbi:hypothetical protein SNEBB_011129 [Seison nebaliae]|nr:hypothetical protein SNEBB_011129 [Seison nebaliae]
MTTKRYRSYRSILLIILFFYFNIYLIFFSRLSKRFTKKNIKRLIINQIYRSNLDELKFFPPLHVSFVDCEIYDPMNFIYHNGEKNYYRSFDKKQLHIRHFQKTNDSQFNSTLTFVFKPDITYLPFIIHTMNELYDIVDTFVVLIYPSDVLLRKYFLSEINTHPFLSTHQEKIILIVDVKAHETWPQHLLRMTKQLKKMSLLPVNILSNETTMNNQISLNTIYDYYKNQLDLDKDIIIHIFQPNIILRRDIILQLKSAGKSFSSSTPYIWFSLRHCTGSFIWYKASPLLYPMGMSWRNFLKAPQSGRLMYPLELKKFTSVNHLLIGEQIENFGKQMNLAGWYCQDCFPRLASSLQTIKLNFRLSKKIYEDPTSNQLPYAMRKTNSNSYLFTDTYDLHLPSIYI